MNRLPQWRFSISSREHWLNGWYRFGDDGAFVSGRAVCIGCGKTIAVCTSVASDSPPEKHPDWPFEEIGCPVCALRAKYEKAEAELRSPETERADKLTERMLAMEDARVRPGPSPTLTREMAKAIYDWEESGELAEQLALRLYWLIGA